MCGSVLKLAKCFDDTKQEANSCLHRLSSYYYDLCQVATFQPPTPSYTPLQLASTLQCWDMHGSWQCAVVLCYKHRQLLDSQEFYSTLCFICLFFPVSSCVKNKPCDRLADLPKQSYGTPNILNVSETAGSRKSSVGITTGTWTETALR